MDSKDILMMFDTPQKKLSTKYTSTRLQKVTWGGGILHLSNTITFFCYVLKE